MLIAFPGSVKECTDASPSTPVLVRKVEYKTNAKARMIKRKLAFKEWPVWLYTSMVCRPAIKINHGTRDAFSTGSQAQ